MADRFNTAERQVAFTADGTAKYRLYYPEALIRLTLDDLKTLFRYMIADSLTLEENAAAVIATQEELEAIKVLADNEIVNTSVAYVNGYRHIDRAFTVCHSAGEIKEVKGENNRLESAVKSAKHIRKKIDKRQELLNEELSRYGLTVDGLKQIYQR